MPADTPEPAGEALCGCPRWLARSGISDEHIRKVERRAGRAWLCLRCRRPFLPYERLQYVQRS